MGEWQRNLYDDPVSDLLRLMRHVEQIEVEDSAHDVVGAKVHRLIVSVKVLPLEYLCQTRSRGENICNMTQCGFQKRAFNCPLANKQANSAEEGKYKIVKIL